LEQALSALGVWLALMNLLKWLAHWGTCTALQMPDTMSADILVFMGRFMMVHSLGAAYEEQALFRLKLGNDQNIANTRSIDLA
jgi:hypothetical protein